MSRKAKESLKKEAHDHRRYLFEQANNHLGELVSSSTEKFVKHLADPRKNPAAPAPAASAEYAGMCQVISGKSVFETTIGTNGYGIVIVDPSQCAACEDRALAINSTATANLSTATAIAAMLTSSATHVAQYPARTGYTGASLGSNSGGDFTAITNACAAYIKPIDAATAQNGMMYLLEVPTHPILASGAGLTVGGVISHPRTRSVSGVQLASPDVENCINYHQQNGSGSSNWLVPAAATANLQNGPLIIVVQGAAGTVYNVEVCATWLAKGRRTSPAKPIYLDFPGAQALYNMLLHKRLSGWVGTSSEVVQAYRLALGHSARRSLPDSVRKEQDARALLDREKATRPRSSWFVDAIKAAAPLVSDVAGFFLK